MSRRSWILVAAFYAVLAISCLAPLASDTVMPADGEHIAHTAAIVQARLALEHGQFPIRVAPWQHQGWQYPLFQFIAPLPYTLAALDSMWIAGGNPFVAYKHVLWLSSVLGAFFVYLAVVRVLRSPQAALVAGAAYMTMPYLLAVTYAQGAFPQAAAAGVTPLVLYATLRGYEPVVHRSWVFVAAIAWGLLALTDYVSWLWVSSLCALLFGLASSGVAGAGRRLLRIAAAWLLGLALALSIIAPIEGLRGSLQGAASWRLISREGPVPLSTLLAPIPIPPEPQIGSYSQPVEPASVKTWPIADFSSVVRTPTVGWPALIALGIVIWTFWRPLGPDAPMARESRRFGAVLAGLCLLAIVLAWVTGSDRFLIPVMWSGAVLVAYALVLVSRGTLGLPETVGALLLIAVVHGSFLPMLRSTPVTPAELVQKPDLQSLGDVCLLVPFSRARSGPNEPLVMPVDACANESTGVRCRMTVPAAGANLLLPMLFYPDLLAVTIDGRDAPYTGSRRERVMLTSVQVPAGMHELTARVRGYTWANVTSLIAWIGTLLGLAASAIRFPIRFLGPRP